MHILLSALLSMVVTTGGISGDETNTKNETTYQEPDTSGHSAIIMTDINGI